MSDRTNLVEAVRRACIEAALDAYEDAGLRGLCVEGRWEAAIDAVRGLDLAALAASADQPGERALPLANPYASKATDEAKDSTGEAEREDDARRDIRDEDLHGLLDAFYDTLRTDALLATYFTEVDMAEHIPRIADFWSTILFRTRRYADNAFAPHMRMPGLTAAHFERWVSTLEATVDARFAGPAAKLMKETAHRIAYSMQLRLGIPPFEPYRPVTS